jgi:tRNA threonylcarbamoyl adenosine modification protein YeaZ
VSVLAIDTSSRSRVVCVVATADGELLDSEVIRDRPVAASLPPALARMLAAVDRAVVVVTGPGAYTGVRAGMAGALGVAHARRLPLHGVGSLEVVACGDPDAAAGDWVVADAGRGALYVARAGDAANPSRIRRAGFDAAGARVVSTDNIGIAGVVLVDPARALARAVPLALSRPALERAGLSAVYVDATPLQ